MGIGLPAGAVTATAPAGATERKMPCPGYKHTPEELAKMSAAVSGDKNPAKRPEVRAKISASCKGRVPWNKNKPMCEAQKAKLSTAKKGRPWSDAAREAHRVERAGREFSPKQWAALAAMQAARIGTHHTAEAKAKTGAGNSGPKSARWMGGISRLPYAWEFNDELKEEVRRRDGYKCRVCGIPQTECKQPLNVHHTEYDKQDSDPVGLVALCSRCHARTNTHREHWTETFRAMAIERKLR